MLVLTCGYTMRCNLGMDLKQFLNTKTMDEREKLAIECGTTWGHLRNVMYGLRPCSPELAAALELNTRSAITRQDLRPDDWPRIWPELVKGKTPKRKATQE